MANVATGDVVAVRLVDFVCREIDDFKVCGDTAEGEDLFKEK
jgi:hypothetical protein